MGLFWRSCTGAGGPPAESSKEVKRIDKDHGAVCDSQMLGCIAAEVRKHSREWAEEWQRMSSDFQQHLEEGIRAEHELREFTAEFRGPTLSLGPQHSHTLVHAAAEQPLSDAIDELRSGVVDLRSALCRAWDVDDFSAESASIKAANVQVLRSEVEASAVAAATEQVTALKELLDAEQRHLREQISKELLGQLAELADGSAAVESELEVFRSGLAEVIGDGVEMRRQVLELCDVWRHSASAGKELQGDGGSHVAALRTRLERVEGAKWDALDEVRSRIAEAAESASSAQREVEILAARVDAGEQNASRGLVMLQQAIEALQQEQAEMRKLVSAGAPDPSSGKRNR